MTRRRIGLVVVVALLLTGCAAGADRSEEAVASAAGAAAEGVASGAVAGDDATLDDRYLACVQRAGVDLQNAQVVLGDDGRPWAVKTGFDVPAEVHGPCLESIGGPPDDRTTSSWGPTLTEDLPVGPAPTDEEIAALAATVDDFAAGADGGAVVLLRRHGRSELLTSGAADADGTAFTADSRFRVGSISKPFVATMVLQMVDEGAIDLDATLDTYLPDLPIGANVTVRQLLGHRSGLPDYTQSRQLQARTMMQITEIIEPDEIVDMVVDESAGTPGLSYRYSNTNYLLAGLLIEAIDGVDLNTALANRITGPLGLAATDFAIDAVDPPTVGFWLVPLSAGDPDAPYTAISSGAWAAGALASTAPDLLVFLDALRSGQLLAPATLDLMTDTSGSGNYGLGISGGNLGSPAIGHNGIIPGFTSYMAASIENDDALIVLTNNLDLHAERLARQIVKDW